MASRSTATGPSLGELLALCAALALSAPARAQQYTVSEEEDGTRPTVYTLRNNWSQPPGRDYHNTTMIGDGASGCGEFPCLDDGEAGDLPPNGKRNGTATAVITGMVPGTYQVEFFFRQSENRSRSVPWRLFSDAATNNTRADNINQYDAVTWGTDEGWRVLDDTDAHPISVASRLTFVFGSDSLTFSGSISYGGIRATRVVVTAVDAGGHDAASAGGCQGIASHAGYELCQSTATTCSGVYTNGDGCTAYCAAAGMVCRTRYGASPGCAKEPQYPIACGAINDHMSNWCDCALPSPPDAGVVDTAPPPDATRPDLATPDLAQVDRAVADVRQAAEAGAWLDVALVDTAVVDAAHSQDDDASGAAGDAGGDDDGADDGADAGAADDASAADAASNTPVDYVGVAGGSCRAGPRSSTWLAVLLLAALLRRRGARGARYARAFSTPGNSGTILLNTHSSRKGAVKMTAAVARPSFSNRPGQ